MLLEQSLTETHHTWKISLAPQMQVWVWNVASLSCFACPRPCSWHLINKQKTCGGVIKGTAGMNLGSATAWQQTQGRLEDHMKGVLDKVYSPPTALRCPILAPLAARVKINVRTIYMPIESYKQVFLGELVSEIGSLNFYHCGCSDDVLICWNETLNCWKGNYEKVFGKDIMRNYLIVLSPGFSMPLFLSPCQ